MRKTLQARDRKRALRRRRIQAHRGRFLNWLTTEVKKLEMQQLGEQTWARRASRLRHWQSRWQMRAPMKVLTAMAGVRR